ncbi:MAG: glycosyltransferase family 39 protein, partial [Kiritimatiellia bacterium]|nr:glycosyltransferase family 39 protein [Kiritimatiellia bacterium]
LCAFGLFDHSFWSGNDTREGAMISEMARTHTWVTPVFNGAHYFEKPPLLHWTGVIFCRIFGVVNEGLVRLPAAIYAFFTLLIVISWARSLDREAAGFAAAFMCATSALFFEYARIVLTDSALTFMVVFSLWLFWRAYTAQKRIIVQYLLFLFVSAFSFYAKGLIGPGMIWLSVMAWLCFQKRFRLALLLPLAFILVFAVVLAPWVFALWKTGGSLYLYKVFWENQFGRFLYFNDLTLPLDPYLVHKEPVYFYLLSLPVRLLPWTLLVIPALYYWFRRASPLKDELALFLKTSLLAFAFLLHISSAKAACYALPLFPLIFLMTGIWLEDEAVAWPATFTKPSACPDAGLATPATPQAWQAAWSSWLVRRLIIITFVLTGIAIVAVPAAYLLAFFFGMQAVRTPCAATGWACFLIALIAVVVGFILGKKIRLVFMDGKRRTALLTMPVVVAVIGVFGGAAFVPAVDYYRTYVPFSRMVQGELNTGRRIAFGSDSERDLGAFMFYLDSRLDTVSFTNRVSLDSFLRDKREPVGIIVPTKELKLVLHQLRDLPFRIKQAEHAGKKSDSFRLITMDPARKEEAEPPKPKSGRPKRAGK